MTTVVPVLDVVAARRLGRSDDPVARAALLNELLANPPLDVEHACIEALETQVCEAPTHAVRALRRWLVLDAARQAMLMSLPTAAHLAGLASRRWQQDDGVVTDTAFEVMPAPRASMSTATAIDIVSPEAYPVAEWLSDLVRPEDYAAVGPGYEPKYRVVSVSQSEDRGLRVSLTRTTWEQGASFHQAMRRLQPDRELTDRALSAWLGNWSGSLPGIVSVHCLVLTSEGMIVQTRRPGGTLYSPGQWSLSFEEQVTAADFESPVRDAVTTAALRGFSEEFGLAPDISDVTIVSAVIEMPILNPGLIAVVRTEASANDFRVAYAHGRTSEIDAISFYDSQASSSTAVVAREDLHPTSAIRVLILDRLNSQSRPA